MAERQTSSGRRERKRRPDGSLYSSDPSERMKQLQADGKVGPQFGALGGRPRKRRSDHPETLRHEERTRRGRAERGGGGARRREVVVVLPDDEDVEVVVQLRRAAAPSA